jgi:hypothetical protein
MLIEALFSWDNKKLPRKVNLVQPTGHVPGIQNNAGGF